jgi:hypothetical protein
MTAGEPFNIEAERAMLCAMLREPSCIEGAASIAGPGDFSKAHAPVYFRLLEHFQSGENPDLITVTNSLKEHGELEAAGGPVYLSGLLDMGASGANVRAYAELVKKSADARRAREAIKTALQRVSNGNGHDPQQAIGELIRELQAIHDPQEENEIRAFPNLAGKIREYIAGIDGTFYTHQLCADLGITNPRDKTNVRQILKRLKGKQIQPHGNQAGCWRVVRGEIETMDLQNTECDELNLWLPLDLHNYVTIMPGNVIVVTGDPDAGKTAFLLRTIRQNLDKWNCHYFNSEMGALELRKRLNLFKDFPVTHPHFHAYERGVDFEDVIQPGKYTLNVIDYLEITDEFYLISKRLQEIYRNLRESVAIVAIQKRSKTSDLPLGAQRALEKPRLAIALSAGNKTTPNRATILKCKNRKTDHSMIGLSRPFKLVAGCEFRSESPVWS